MINITEQEITIIRSLDDFDLIKLLNDLNEHGWPLAKLTLRNMYMAIQVEAAIMKELNEVH